MRLNSSKKHFHQSQILKKIKIFRSNKNPIPQYDFGDVDIISEDENSGLNSWENFREKFLSFLETIPNHVKIKLDTGFFEGQAPETEEMFRNEMAEFGNNLQVLAADEAQVIEEWNNISEETDSNFQSLLVGTTEKMALENFIDSNLHPRFVYFSDYKKIIGNVNLNEYRKEENRSKYRVYRRGI